MQAQYLQSRFSRLGCARNARNTPEVKGINQNEDASYALTCAIYGVSTRIP